MKYLKSFQSKQDYLNTVLPQVSIIADEVVYDAALQTVNLSDITTELRNSNKDYIIHGAVENKVLSIEGKSINMSNVSISGTIDKIISNTAVSLNEMKTVEIIDSHFDASTYNMIEIGLNSDKLPSLVNITNCDFDTMSNNAITIFGFVDNAVINIKNCHFKSVSNAIRLSNKTNAQNVTVNIENCVCDNWDPRKEYSGFMLLQEYPIGMSDFSGITINIKNLVGPNGQVLGNPETICGTQDENQVIYVYSNNAVQSYNSIIYPKININ